MATLQRAVEAVSGRNSDPNASRGEVDHVRFAYAHLNGAQTADVCRFDKVQPLAFLFAWGGCTKISRQLASSGWRVHESEASHTEIIHEGCAEVAGLWV